MIQPQKIEEEVKVFGATVKDLQKLLPKKDEVPAEFFAKKKNGIRWVNPYSEIVESWFNVGLSPNVITEKEGIDKMTALNHLGVCLRAYSLDQETKIASVAYLMSQWFDIVPQEDDED